MKESQEHHSLLCIKQIVDAYQNNNIELTIGNDDFDCENHIYDLDVVIGMIQNHTYQGLGLPIPNVHKDKITKRKE